MKLLTCLPAGAVRLLASVICVSGLAFSGGALARTCEFTNPNGFDLQDIIPVFGTGVSTIGEDIPIGTTIYTSMKATGFSSGTSASITCDTYEETTIQRTLDVISTPSGIPITSGGVSVYPTNIQGIGVSFFIMSYQFPEATTFPDVVYDVRNIGTTEGVGTSSFYFGILSIVRFSLIKTGPIDTLAGTQQVLASSFPTFQISASMSPSDNVNEKIFTTISFTGAVTFHTKTCQIAVPDISVDLGLHPLSDFKAPGTTTEWKGFDITLQNCPPFYGYGVTNADWGNGTVSSTGGQTNKVGLTFNSANGVVEGNPALAKIESGPDAAQGIGIEMQQQNDSTAIPLDGSGGFDLQNLTTTDGGTYVVPLKARYFQYDSDVKAGPANGAVVFTITYQ